LQWYTNFEESYDELYLSYRIKFSEEFLIQDLQGKLPGLAGGTEKHSGGSLPDGKTGWSARFMFNQTNIAFYLYHPDNHNNGFYKDPEPVEGKRYYGQHIRLSGGKQFGANEWIKVAQHIVLNTPGKRDGYIEAFINGELAAKKENMRFRDIPELAIDKIFFGMFLGGSGKPPTSDAFIYVDDFKVYYY
jgi:hypothetical protein